MRGRGISDGDREVKGDVKGEKKESKGNECSRNCDAASLNVLVVVNR